MAVGDHTGAIDLAEPAELGERHRWLPFLPAATASAAPPLLLDDADLLPDDAVALHGAAPDAVPALGCHVLKDVLVGGAGHMAMDGRIVVGRSITGHWRNQLLRGEMFDSPLSTKLPERRLAGAAILIGGPGFTSYGHLLLDILPRLWTLRGAIRTIPADVPILLPSFVRGFARQMLRTLGIHQDRVHRYSVATETLRVETLLVPTLAHGDFWFHPAAAGYYAALADRIGDREPVPRRVFISRAGVDSGRGRLLADDRDLIAALEPLGFVAIRPETLPWPRQVAIFAGAEVIAGVHGSALKSTVFSRRGTGIVNIDLLNDTQSRIAGLRGHRLAYLRSEPADDGDLRRVDPRKLVRCAQAAIAATAAQPPGGR